MQEKKVTVILLVLFGLLVVLLLTWSVLVAMPEYQRINTALQTQARENNVCATIVPRTGISITDCVVRRQTARAPIPTADAFSVRSTPET